MKTDDDFYNEIEDLLTTERGLLPALKAVRNHYKVGDERRDSAVALMAEWDALKIESIDGMTDNVKAGFANLRRRLQKLLRSGLREVGEDECLGDPVPFIDRVEILSDFQAFLSQSLAMKPQVPIVVVAFGHKYQGHSDLTKRLVSLDDGLQQQSFNMITERRRIKTSYSESDCETRLLDCICKAAEVNDIESLMRDLNNYQEHTLHVFEIQIYSTDRAEWDEMFPEIQVAIDLFEEFNLAEPVSLMLKISIKFDDEKTEDDEHEKSWFPFWKQRVDRNRNPDCRAREILETLRENPEYRHQLRVLPELGHIQRRHLNDWKYSESTKKYLRRKGIDLDRFNEKVFDLILTPDLTLLDFKDKFSEWVSTEQNN